MPELLEALQAGGNVAMIAIAAALWRFDRRILALEICLKSVKRKLERGL